MGQDHSFLETTYQIRTFQWQRQTNPGFLTANPGFFPPEHAVCSSDLSFDGETSRSNEGALGQRMLKWTIEKSAEERSQKGKRRESIVSEYLPHAMSRACALLHHGTLKEAGVVPFSM